MTRLSGIVVSVVIGVILALSGAAPAVTFSTADLAGRWSLQSLGIEGVVGTKYTGIVEFDATGAVVGGTAAPDWEIGYFTGGGLFVNPDGLVQGTIEGTTDSGTYPLLIKQGAMHLTKDQITLTASSAKAYNHLLALVKIKEEEEADYLDSDLDGVWEFHSHAYYDIHADYNYGQIIVSGGVVTGEGSQHSSPCTYTGTLALSDSARGVKHAQALARPPFGEVRRGKDRIPGHGRPSDRGMGAGRSQRCAGAHLPG